MMGESCVCLGSKEIRVFGSFRPFFKISQIFQIFLKYIKHYEKLSTKLTKNLDFFASEAYTTGVHLINVELSQLLTLVTVCETID